MELTEIDGIRMGYVETMTERDAAFYLAALIDGEGCVYAPGGANKKRCIQVSNTDPTLITAAMDCCDILGLRYTINLAPRKYPRRDCITLMISGQDDLRLCQELLPLRSRKKADRLAGAIDSYVYHQVPRLSMEETRARGRRWRGKAAALKLDALVRGE